MRFDDLIDRRGTGSIKWDDPYNEAGKPDVLPLWVADMDFAAPEPVLQAIRQRAEHPVFGYTRESPDYYAAVAEWYAARYGCPIGSEAILLAPGMIPSLIVAVRALTAPGAGVVVFTPVYYPFYDIIRDNQRECVPVRLGEDESFRFRIDYEALEKALAEARERGIAAEAILFCSPHNPGGRIWSSGELDTLLAFAKERGLAFICDEIHGDIALARPESATEPRFVSAADRGTADSPPVVALGAPNKTFNLAGLHLSHFAVPRENTRALIRQGIAAAGFSQPNVFSITAARAAYRLGGAWLDELNAYLRSNVDYLLDFLARFGGEVTAVRPDGGYLVWVHAAPLISRLGYASDQEFTQALAREGRVRFNFGRKFGPGGEFCLRINAACPRSLLEEGLHRFEEWTHRK